MPCKWPSDAGPHAIAERLPAVGKFLLPLDEVFLKHAFGPEFFGVLTIDDWIAVDLREKRDDRDSLSC